MIKDPYKSIVLTQLEELKRRIIQNHLSAGQRASGKTIRDFEYGIDGDYAYLKGRRAIGTLETGRKPGKVPAGFYGIILRWIHDKGISVEKPKTMAYFVARKIAREGTKLFRDGGREDIYSNEIPKTIKTIQDDAANAAVKELFTILRNVKD